MKNLLRGKKRGILVTFYEFKFFIVCSNITKMLCHSKTIEYSIKFYCDWIFIVFFWCIHVMGEDWEFWTKNLIFLPVFDWTIHIIKEITCFLYTFCTLNQSFWKSFCSFKWKPLPPRTPSSSKEFLQHQFLFYVHLKQLNYIQKYIWTYHV